MVDLWRMDQRSLQPVIDGKNRTYYVCVVTLAERRFKHGTPLDE